MHEDLPKCICVICNTPQKGALFFWYFLINAPQYHAGIYTYFVEINRGC